MKLTSRSTTPGNRLLELHGTLKKSCRILLALGKWSLHVFTASSVSLRPVPPDAKLQKVAFAVNSGSQEQPFAIGSSLSPNEAGSHALGPGAFRSRPHPHLIA